MIWMITCDENSSLLYTALLIVSNAAAWARNRDQAQMNNYQCQATHASVHWTSQPRTYASLLSLTEHDV